MSTSTNHPVISGWLSLEQTLAGADSITARTIKLAYFLGWANCASHGLNIIKDGGSREHLIVSFEGVAADLKRLADAPGT